MTPRQITSKDWSPGMGLLRFDAAAHRYFCGDLELPGVTRILRQVGVSSDFHDVPADVLNAKRDLGTAVHMAAHYYDDGTLDPKTVDPRVTPYLDAWHDFRNMTGFTPVLLETPLWHSGLLIAGTIDRAGYFAKFPNADPSKLYAVDIKCGDPDDAGAKWQTAAYSEMLSACLDRSSPFADPMMRTRPTFSVKLNDNGTYRLYSYPDTLRNWSEFTHFVTTFRRQHPSRADQRVSAAA